MIIRKLFQDTSKRTVLTIPAFIRDHLGLKNGDEVAVEFDGDMIKVKPIGKKVNEMANTRKHCQGNVHLHEVRMSFEEWLEGLVEYTADKGRRECAECGEGCECIEITQPRTGLCLTWQCERNHRFKQDIPYAQLQQMYRKAKPTKYVHETAYPSKAKRWGGVA